MAKIAKRYAAVINECYDNIGFHLEDLAYYTGGKIVHKRDDEDLPNELVEEIENIGCIDLVDETNFLVYNENYEQVEFTTDQLREILKPLNWIAVVDENDSTSSIDVSRMGEFNTDSKSTIVEYVKNNCKAKIVLENVSNLTSHRAFNVKYNLHKELREFLNKNKNPSLSSFGMLVTGKKEIDDFLSKLSPENLVFINQDSKTDIQLFAFANEKQFEEFKANSIAYRRYQDYLKEVRSGKVNEKIDEEKEYTKELMNKDMKNPEFKKSSRYNAQMIMTDIMKKLQNKEIILGTNDILKVVLPENKVVCLFNAKQGIQMLGFQNEEHFKDFANQNLADKKIIEYENNENESENE